MKTGVCDVIFELRNVQVTVSNDDINKHFVSFSFLHPISLADPRGAPGTRAPPWGSKFFHFHAVFGKKIEK